MISLAEWGLAGRRVNREALESGVGHAEGWKAHRGVDGERAYRSGRVRREGEAVGGEELPAVPQMQGAVAVMLRTVARRHLERVCWRGRL